MKSGKMATGEGQQGWVLDELAFKGAHAGTLERLPRATPGRFSREPGTDEFEHLVPESEAAPSHRDSFRRRILAVADVLALCIAYGVVWLTAPPDATIANKLVLVGALPLWVLLNKVVGLYDRDGNLIHKSTLDELPQLLQSVVLGASLLFLLGPMLPGVDVGREQTLVFVAAAILILPTLRAWARWSVNRSFLPERCVIVGSGSVTHLMAQKIAAHPEYGVTVVGCVDLPLGGSGDGGAPEIGPPLLGDIDDFAAICDRYGIERVVVAFSSRSYEHLLNVIRTAKRLRMKISIVPRLYEVLGHAVDIDQVEGMTLFGMRAFERPRSSLALKRAIDAIGSGVALLVMAPLLAVIAAAVKLTSRGPVLFAQERIGKGDKPFRMYKFRTMYDGADELKPALLHLNEADGVMFKMADDPRMTPLGRLLRRASLDELPQLWNVLRGEMSLVGPRPLIPDENAHLIGWHRLRLNLTPGVTGPWQVLGRTRIPFAEMVRLDYLYVGEWSLWNDIKLLIRTVPVVLQRRGA